MDRYHEAALRLQKSLLDLRRESQRLRSIGELEKANRLAQAADCMQSILDNSPPGLKPTTLH